MLINGNITILSNMFNKIVLTKSQSTSIFQSNATVEYLCLASLSISIIMFIVVLVQGSKLKKMRKNYEIFMAGKDGQNLEDSIINYFKQIDELGNKSDKTQQEQIAIRNNFEIEMKNMRENFTKDINAINENLIIVYQKIGIVKYDAFKEMGGKLSFAIALLDKKNSGFVLNSMHNREGCYTYVKEILNGQSYVLLCDEEKEAVDKAVNYEKIQ